MFIYFISKKYKKYKKHNIFSSNKIIITVHSNEMQDVGEYRIKWYCPVKIVYFSLTQIELPCSDYRLKYKKTRKRRSYQVISILTFVQFPYRKVYFISFSFNVCQFLKFINLNTFKVFQFFHIISGTIFNSISFSRKKMFPVFMSTIL